MTKGLLAARVLALTIAAIGVSVGPGGVATATPAVTTLGTPERLADRQPAACDDDSGTTRATTTAIPTCREELQACDRCRVAQNAAPAAAASPSRRSPALR
jgi:hypothetical protein